jgi:lysophospholipase L1-like esterase
VYERAKAMTRSIAARADVPVRFFWQPAAGEGDPERRAKAELTSSTIDISDVLLDHPEVFLDGVHTNEEGARIVAERMWEDLRPTIEAWYEARS